MGMGGGGAGWVRLPETRVGTGEGSLWVFMKSLPSACLGVCRVAFPFPQPQQITATTLISQIPGLHVRTC